MDTLSSFVVDSVECTGVACHKTVANDEQARLSSTMASATISSTPSAAEAVERAPTDVEVEMAHRDESMRRRAVPDLDAHVKCFNSQNLPHALKALRYEHKVEEAKDFGGSFTLRQFLREFSVEVTYIVLGPILSLLILWPCLGTAILQRKLFLPGRVFRVYLYQFTSACIIPVSIVHFVVSERSVTTDFVVDFVFICLLFLMRIFFVSVRYGYMHKNKYRALYVKNSATNASGTHLWSGKMVFAFCQLVGTTKIHHDYLREEIISSSSRILKMENDVINMPTTLLPSKRKKGRLSIVQNEDALVHNCDVHDNENLRTVSELAGLNATDLTEQVPTKNIALALGKIAVDDMDKSAVKAFYFSYCPSMLVVIFLVLHIPRWTEIYNEMWWTEWVFYVLLLDAYKFHARFILLSVASLNVSLSRKLFFEERLTLIIHQMKVRTIEDIHAWTRLHLCMQEVGITYFRGSQLYSTIMVAYTLVIAAVLYLNETFQFVHLSLLQSLLWCTQIFVLQAAFLRCLHVGSNVTKQMDKHSREWLKVYSRLSQRLQELLYHEASATPDESKPVRLQIQTLSNTMNTIKGLNESMKLERLHGGVRFVSFRITRLFMKSAFILFAYQWSYLGFLLVGSEFDLQRIQTI